jgi:hypothetical protein
LCGIGMGMDETVHPVYVCELTSFKFVFQKHCVALAWPWMGRFILFMFVNSILSYSCFRALCGIDTGMDGSSCLCLWTDFLHIHVSGHCVALAWAWMRWFILFMFVNSLPSYSCFRALCGIGMGMDEMVHPVYVCELTSFIFMFQGIVWHWHGHGWDGSSCLCLWTQFSHIHVSGHFVALAWAWMRRFILFMCVHSLP